MARDDFGREERYGPEAAGAAPGSSAHGYRLQGPTAGGYGGPGDFTGQQGGFTSVGHGVGYRQGDFSGRGPRQYCRSDDRTYEDVCDALTRHPAVDATEVDVRIENGEVILTGTVEDRYVKRLAEDAAERVSGVADVPTRSRFSAALENGTPEIPAPGASIAPLPTTRPRSRGRRFRRATRRSTSVPATKT